MAQEKRENDTQAETRRKERGKIADWIGSNCLGLWVQGTSYKRAATAASNQLGFKVSARRVSAINQNHDWGIVRNRWRGRARRLRHVPVAYRADQWGRLAQTLRQMLKASCSLTVEEITRRLMDSGHSYPVPAVKSTLCLMVDFSATLLKA